MYWYHAYNAADQIRSRKFYFICHMFLLASSIHAPIVPHQVREKERERERGCWNGNYGQIRYTSTSHHTSYKGCRREGGGEGTCSTSNGGGLKQVVTRYCCRSSTRQHLKQRLNGMHGESSEATTRVIYFVSYIISERYRMCARIDGLFLTTKAPAPAAYAASTKVSLLMILRLGSENATATAVPANR